MSILVRLESLDAQKQSTDHEDSKSALKTKKKIYKTLKIKVKVVIKQINFILGNFKKVISYRKNRTSLYF